MLGFVFISLSLPRASTIIILPLARYFFLVLLLHLVGLTVFSFSSFSTSFVPDPSNFSSFPFSLSPCLPISFPLPFFFLLTEQGKK